MHNPRDMKDHVTFCPQPNRMLDRGVEGELRTVRYLYDNLQPRLVGNYQILVNYNFPQHGANTLEIDLLVITRYGIFVVEVKNWLGRIDADDEFWYLNGHRRENVLYPTSMKAKKLHSHVSSSISGLSVSAYKVSVTPHIVLVRGTQKFHNHSNSDSNAVMGLDQQLLHTFSSTDQLHNPGKNLRITDRDISTISKALFRRHQTDNEEIVERYRLLGKVRSTALFDEFDAQSTEVRTRKVRLKCYHLHNISDERITEQTIERFKRSIEVVDSLGYHQNIIQTKDFFPDPKYYDLYYEVTDPIDGKRLDEILQQKQSKGQTFTHKEQISIINSLCQALQHAHNHTDADSNPQPVYHRNLGLETVFHTHDSRHKPIIKLADFDFAKFGTHTISPMFWKDIADRQQAQIRETFTAPELLANISDASAQSDIYSLGVLWYFLALLPAFDPLQRFNPSKDNNKIDELTTMSPEMRTLLKRMVAYERKDRPQNIEEVIEAISQVD